MTKQKMSSKEYDAWQAWLKNESAVKADRRGVPSGLWIALIVLVAVLGAALMSVTGRPYNAVYIVATPTPGPEHQIRFLCMVNGDQLLPRMSVTWVRENGQTVDDATDGSGCTMIPADEPVGILDHVHQTTHWIWPGARPVCLDISGGGIYSGNLCPPG